MNGEVNLLLLYPNWIFFKNMKVAVTGGTGFIGNYVVNSLLDKGIEVVVIDINDNKTKDSDWFQKVEFLHHDINDLSSDEILQKIASCGKLIHLAWVGLPNYSELFHFEENLLPQYLFLKKLVSLGLSDLTITGTCFEYGMKSGPLSTNMPSDPQNPYALAKDTLRKFLQQLQQKENFKLKWLRLFYMYGKGQSKNSILSQLEQAIKNGDEVFNMSGGEQIRDYLHVMDAAKLITERSLSNDQNGIFNICSGVPITIRKLVEDYLLENKKSIKLNYGYYQYPDWEPMAFWGV
jgi:nucleoside-diphosphate-sugar epimerase